MKILHISAECYPAAKAGGLGDVVGALPKYLTEAGVMASVVIPRYSLPWINKRKFKEVHRGNFRMHYDEIPYSIQMLDSEELGFPFYVAAIPGRFDRPGVYADPSGHPYRDEVERYLSFQYAVLDWVKGMAIKPKVLHCHDHHTGLIPFFVKYSEEYRSLASIPTVFTVHNGVYHGTFSWSRIHLLPYFNSEYSGFLEWNNAINPLASGVKCSWKLTTVSPGYLQELKYKSQGLEWLFNNESVKSEGILNGIDTSVWDPKTDAALVQPMKKSLPYFKKKNKQVLCEQFGFDPKMPLFTFIGRLVNEKGADLLPSLITRFIQSGHDASFLILGTGEAWIMDSIRRMRYEYQGRFNASLEYNEGLAHQMYAGSDFLLMPSRVEPCGLNQMYALRYGTVPVVRAVGGLGDTIIDIGNPGGCGIRFDHFTLEDAALAVYRGTELYKQKQIFNKLREYIITLDHSWENSANKYLEIYKQLTRNKL